MKARIDFVEDSSSEQTETTVSNNSECIIKIRPTKLVFHALPNCKAKSTLLLDSINTNNSTSGNKTANHWHKINSTLDDQYKN